MRLVIPPRGVVGVCARARFSLLILAVDFCRRLPGGPSVIGGKGEVCRACAEQTRRRVGSRRVRPVLFPSTKQSRLVFLAVSRAVCLSWQISLPSRRLREQKNLFTSIQGIHKTRRLIIKTLQNLTCPDETSSAQPIKGCCLRGGAVGVKGSSLLFFICFV